MKPAVKSLPVSGQAGFCGTAQTTTSLQHIITLAFGRNNCDTNPRPVTMTLGELIADFSVPDTKRSKLSSAEYHALRKDVPEEKKPKDAAKNGRYVIVARFSRPRTRKEIDVAGVNAIALDFDSGHTTEAILREKLRGITYVAYTSFSHRPENERWRVIVLFSKEATKEQHKRTYHHFQNLFDGDLDPRCGVASQLWYTPACPHDAIEDFRCIHEIGALFDPSTLPEEQPAPDSIKPTKNTKATARSAKLLAPAPNPASRVESQSLDRVADALAYLDSDDRQTWIAAGLAIKHDLGEEGRDLWMDWSKTSPKFDDAEADATWNTFKDRDEGEPVVTLGTVFHKAKEAGWDDGATPEFIAKMNEEYFVAPIGRHVEIFREHMDLQFGHRTVTPMDRDDFQLKHENKFVTVVSADGTAKRVNLAKAWRTHRARREFEGVVLSPNREVPGCYNRWRGFTVEPNKGPARWRRMRWHILFVICAGDRHAYRYVLGWLAFCVQRPGERAHVALVLQGGRGTGKGMFVSALGRLFGLHFQHVTHAKHLTGHFNAHLADCLVLFADEAFWAGDKQGESALKAVITESTISIEPKGFDVERAPNMLKIIMASNNDWIVPAGLDERRFCVLAVSDIRQQDLVYFAQLQEEIDNEGLEAMLFDLLHFDLSRFDIRQVPQTNALKEQKLLSLDPMRRWWMDKLTAGEWIEQVGNPPLQVTHSWTCVPKDVVHNDYVRSLQKTGVSRRSSETELGMALQKVLPDGWPKGNKITAPSDAAMRSARVAVYRFPPLAACRAYFEKLAGMDGYAWP